MPDEKLTERLDTRGVRIRLSTRAKLNVVQRLCIGRLTQAQVIREAIEEGVDQLFTKYGKEAIEMLCREMSATDDVPAGAGPMSVNVGQSRQMSGASRTGSLREEKAS